MKRQACWLGAAAANVEVGEFELVWCGLVLGLLWGGRAHAATLQVKPGDALQAVIDHAHAGDVVEIARGLYQGNFVVNKPLTLRGVGRPTLSGGLVGNTLSVESATPLSPPVQPAAKREKRCSAS